MVHLVALMNSCTCTHTHYQNNYNSIIYKTTTHFYTPVRLLAPTINPLHFGYHINVDSRKIILKIFRDFNTTPGQHEAVTNYKTNYT